MFTSVRIPVQPLAALVVAATASVALALVHGGMRPELVALLCLAWVLAGWLCLGPISLLLFLPLIGLFPGGGLFTILSWGFTAAIAGGAIVALLSRDHQKLRAIRAELRDAEHERTLLHRHIQRYPVLLDACLDLSAAREFDHFASVLCLRTRNMLSEVQEVLVFLGSKSEQRCFASSDQDGGPCPRPAGKDEFYVAAEARSLMRRDGNSISLLIPLCADRRSNREDGENLRGVLRVRLISGDVGDRLALELLSALGRLGGLGLAAVDLVHQARTLVLRDDLTGLFGQQEFLRRLDEQGALCQRQRISLGLIMCDMDHLKQFNDAHGHLAGDAALRIVARALTRILPPSSISCRYGGEEFAALIIDTDLETLAALCESLRAGIVAASSEPDQLPVTASFGLAMMHTDKGSARAENARATLQRADAACYQAKAKGRNRVEAAP